MRRKRFAVEVHPAYRGRHTIHMLVYADENGRFPIHATERLNRMGHEVLSWTAVRRNTNTRLPLWRKNQPGIDAACRWLGIKWPVKITRTSHQRRNGSHALRATHGRTPTHYIRVGKNLQPGVAALVLMHELTHAMQAEREVRREMDQDGPANAALWTARDMLRPWRVCSDRSREVRYEERPVEIEARNMEKEHTRFDLTRVAR